MGALTTLISATAEPITLSALKLHLKVDDDTAGLLLSSYLRAAREHVENATRRALMTQTFSYGLDCDWPVVNGLRRIELPIQPIQSVSSVTYVNASGNTTTLGTDQYALRHTGPNNVAFIEPAYEAQWPEVRNQSQAITVTFVAGYASAAAIPESLKTAMILHAELLFDRNPVSKESLESARDSLLSPYRVVRL